MKKSISLILTAIFIMSTILVGCSSNKTDESNSTTVGLENSINEFGLEEVEVTDENGETVTDANGNPLTTEIAVEYVTDKNGNAIAVELDEKGERVTNSKGKDVTHKTSFKPSTSTTVKDELPSVPATKPTTATTTMKNSSEGTTSAELTTIKREKEEVPSTNATGTKVKFSAEDQQTVKQMLEVPYLFNQSYENADGVPTEIATHVAIWMAQREAFNTTSYASSTIVLDLFKYFAQTVVSFKNNCNGANNENITYRTANDTFAIKSFEAPTHSVKLDSIEFLGNNNYYKVTGTVSGTSKAKKVVAIIQKNRLDSTLGFSIKALKWS